jgi:hypothetical protein
MIDDQVQDNPTAFSITKKGQHIEDEEVACSSAHRQPSVSSIRTCAPLCAGSAGLQLGIVPGACEIFTCAIIVAHEEVEDECKERCLNDCPWDLQVDVYTGRF